MPWLEWLSTRDLLSLSILRTAFIFESLEFQSDGAAEEGGDRRHGAAGRDEGRHEFRATDLFVGEVHGCAEIAKLEIFHEFVIGRKASRWTLEFRGIVPVEQFADRTPFRGARDNRIPYLEQNGRLGVPEAGRGETSTGLEVEIKAGRVNVFAAMGKAHGDVRFVWAFVVGESRVAVNAKHGATRGAGVGDEIRCNFGQG